MIKPMTTYIEKMLKATVVVTAAFALVGGSLMLCCMSKTAEASTPVSKVCSHCHPVKVQQHVAKNSQTCDCCKIKPGDSDTLVKLSDIVPSFTKSFYTFVDALAYWPEARLVHLAYTGPPR